MSIRGGFFLTYTIQSARPNYSCILRNISKVSSFSDGVGFRLLDQWWDFAYLIRDRCCDGSGFYSHEFPCRSMCQGDSRFLYGSDQRPHFFHPGITVALCLAINLLSIKTRW